jgi:hypothetical protein
MRWAEHVANTGEIRIAYKIFVRKPEEKRETCGTHDMFQLTEVCFIT